MNIKLINKQIVHFLLSIGTTNENTVILDR